MATGAEEGRSIEVRRDDGDRITGYYDANEQLSRGINYNFKQLRTAARPRSGGTMQHTADDLTALIKERHRSVAAFADAAGIPRQTLYSILADESFTSCSLSSAMAITKALGLDPYAFAEGRLRPASGAASAALVPVYDELVPGKEPETDECFPVPEALLQAHPKAFMLRAHGNAMSRTLPDGFLALVAPGKGFATSEHLYAVSIGNAPFAIRRVILHDNGLTLAPESHDPTYRPQLVDFADPGAPKVKTVGKVVWYCPPAD